MLGKRLSIWLIVLFKLLEEFKFGGKLDETTIHCGPFLLAIKVYFSFEFLKNSQKQREENVKLKREKT